MAGAGKPARRAIHAAGSCGKDCGGLRPIRIRRHSPSRPIASAEAGHLHRTPGHPQLSATPDYRPGGAGGSCSCDPRQHAPGGPARCPRSLPARSSRPDSAGHRRCRRRHQPPAGPPHGELRPAVEPQPYRAAFRTNSPHRPEPGVLPVEPGCPGNQGG